MFDPVCLQTHHVYTLILRELKGLSSGGQNALKRTDFGKFAGAVYLWPILGIWYSAPRRSHPTALHSETAIFASTSF